MDKYLISFFEKNKIDFLNKRFILAISTGIDSIVLLDAFLKLKERFNIEIIVAHVNHHMRKQSDEEEEYIKEYCDNLNIKCFVEELYFNNNQSNFEAVAREKRYQFMFKLYDDVKADYLVLAHHGNDNIETILMRIIRGSSLTGYSGMKEVSCYNNKTIIRPFLGISKEDIIRYQEMNNLKYFHDETNDNPSFTRNRIRMDIIPQLFEESNDLINKFNDFRKTIFEASLVVNSVRDEFIEKYCIRKNNDIEINRKEFIKLSDYLKEEVLFELLKQYKLSKVNINQFIDIICSNKPNYYNWFKNCFMFVLEYNKIIITDKKNTYQNTENEQFEIEIDKPGIYSKNNEKIILISENKNKSGYNLNELWYNVEQLPITIRNRRNGDVIIINGIKKKIKDLFIEKKIPLNKRNKLLMAVKDGNVLNIFGLAKSDLVKDMKNTNLKIYITEEFND